MITNTTIIDQSMIKIAVYLTTEHPVHNFI